MLVSEHRAAERFELRSKTSARPLPYVSLSSTMKAFFKPSLRANCAPAAPCRSSVVQTRKNVVDVGMRGAQLRGVVALGQAGLVAEG
jgi:hypothetical protein